uniref:Uncharacterized protein n=1 Tax=Ananas comosus var. bracteatus TaxID=296719 RepID=A0A6V7P0P1_ANACO|nr:unnamed protein product [Ananas comosus var. bracteatus]
MASKQGKVPETQILEPKVEWYEDTENHVLRVRLPGFKKDDFKVQIDNFGNLTIKGQRPLGENKLELLHKVLQVPSNSNVDKVTGRYEGDCLSITFPKFPAQEKEQVKGMEVPPQKRKDEKEEKREEKPPQKEGREEPKSRDEKFEKDYGSPDKKPKYVNEEKEKKEEKVEQKEEYSRPQEAMPSSGVGEEAGPKKREKATAWKKKVKEVIEGWSDYEFLDDLKETIYKKKEVIAVAVAAFTIGFYVSRKLK